RSSENYFRWSFPRRMSADAYKYVVAAPPSAEDPGIRLPYFVQFLDHPDSMIANDAYAEVVDAPVKNLTSIAGGLPRDKLRRWLADPKTPVVRQSGYGMMLGMCGDQEDARFLEQRIAARDPDRQFGLEGVIFGYLLLTGETGLAMVERTRLTDSEVTDSEVYA